MARVLQKVEDDDRLANFNDLNDRSAGRSQQDANRDTRADLKSLLLGATENERSQNGVDPDTLDRRVDDIAATLEKHLNGAATVDARQDYDSVIAALLEQRDGNAQSTGQSNAVSGGDESQSSSVQTSLGGPELMREHVEHTPLSSQRDSDTSPTAAIDDVRVSQGVTSSTKRSSESATGGNLSIIGKSRLVEERPKWGGSTTVPDPADSFKASFDTLRQADKVSPLPEPPSTASSVRPWGATANGAKLGFADSPGELEAAQNSKATDAESEDTQTSESKQESQPEFGSFRGHMGFKKLRNMLFGSEKKATDPKEGQQAARTIDVVSAGTPDSRSDLEGPSISKHVHGAPLIQKQVASSISQHTLDTSSKRGLSRRQLQAEQKRDALRDKRKRETETRASKKRASKSASEAPGAQPVIPADSIETPKNDGRPLGEVMKGRQLTDAMKTEPGPHEEYAHADDPGLPTIEANALEIKALDIPQPSVPPLSFGLDRVLFTPGVTPLQDRHSRVYNFDPYMEHIMPVEEFDFNALAEYKTSSKDKTLSELAKAHGKKYVGSTSSMTGTLSHFHYLLSGWRDLNLGMLSRQFPEELSTFTRINRAPAAIFLRWKNGTYAIDADKGHDSGNILMMLGKSMEKLLTMSKSEYERYRKSDPRKVTEEERSAPEAYQYTTMGDFLMRSQLDAHDPRLPGTGMFDIKTRAIASIRHSTTDFKPMLGYEIHSDQGKWESYEREYYDMMRSTMLKYMLQARMGRMDGIFLTYHNVERIFGFQYMPMAEIDRAIHGQVDRCLGDQEFKLSLHLLNEAINEATAKFPEKSLRFHFETRVAPVTALYVFAEPMEEEDIDKIQSASSEKIAEFERKMMGIEPREDNANVDEEEPSLPKTSEAPTAPKSDTHAPLYAATILIGSNVNGWRVERPEKLKPTDEWSVEYLLKEMENPADAWATYEQCKAARRKALDFTVMMDDEGGAEGFEDEPNFEIHTQDGRVRMFDDFYLEMLRKLAEQGREFRKKLDEMEDGKEKVVWKEGALSGRSTPASVEPEINGVDDYLQWMYKDQKAE